MRVINSVKVLCADHRNMQDSHWALNEITMSLLGLSELFPSLLKTGVICQNTLFNLLFTFNELVLSHDILLRKFVEVDAPIGIIVQLFKKLFDNL